MSEDTQEDEHEPDLPSNRPRKHGPSHLWIWIVVFLFILFIALFVSNGRLFG